MDFDFSVFKYFQISERYKLQFRAEFFNIFNHTNLGLPNAQFDAPSGGENPGQILNFVSIVMGCGVVNAEASFTKNPRRTGCSAAF